MKKMAENRRNVYLVKIGAKSLRDRHQVICKDKECNLIYGIYIALYPDAQSALQHFVGDFARQFTILLKRIVGYTGAPRTE